MNRYPFIADTFLPLQPAAPLPDLLWGCRRPCLAGRLQVFRESRTNRRRGLCNRDRLEEPQYCHECQTRHPRFHVKQERHSGRFDHAEYRPVPESCIFSKCSAVTCSSPESGHDRVFFNVFSAPP